MEVRGALPDGSSPLLLQLATDLTPTSKNAPHIEAQRIER